MHHEEEPPGHGDDEDVPATPWLPPDDRLWRHPSEVRSNPAIVAAAPNRGFLHWARTATARLWLVALASGVVGALLSAGLLWATGSIGGPTAVIARPVKSSAPSTDPGSQAVPSSLIALLGQVNPSIVGLTVNGPSGVLLGSGVLVNTIGDESYVVTDSALFADVDQTTQVQVSTDWGQVQNGYLVASDPSSGIALVKAVLLPVSRAAADGANVGSVANVQTGEAVFAVGSRTIAASMTPPVAAFASGYLNDTLSYVQPVNGASDGLFSVLVASMSVVAPDFGGAVVDASGNVLGIIEQVPDTPDGLTYVTPIDTVMTEVSGMIKDGQAGAYPWLGVLGATDMTQGGIQVVSIGSGSPIARAGLVDNDVITTLDGRGVSTVGALIEWLANARPGQVMSVSWLHGSQRRSAVVTLGTQPLSANPI